MPQTTWPALKPDILTPAQVPSGGEDPWFSYNDYPWHFLAEGDSWFSIGALPSSNLLFDLRLKRWAMVLTLADPGDTLTLMTDPQTASHKTLKKYLSKQNFAWRFEGLLLSGGGNDVIDDAPNLVRLQPPAGANLQDPAAYVDGARLDALLARVAAGFAAMLALRDAPGSRSQGVPAFVHTYDYPTPRNAPALFLGAGKLRGPWLWPVFKGSGLDIGLQQRIVKHLIDALAQTLLALDSTDGDPARQLPHFHVIDTRDTLLPAHPADLGNSNDWLNEIHPNHDGYRKLSARLSQAINAVMA